MTTRPYSELIDLIQALCGEVFATIELPRIKALVNRRAKRAYMACEYWPRWITVGEERTVTSGVIPFTESDKSDIDAFLRIHKEQPYQDAAVQEIDFYVSSSGAVTISNGIDATSFFVTYRKKLGDTYGDGSGETTAIPAEWFEYIAHSVYSDWLRAEKLYEVAVAAEQEADLILSDELAKVDNTGMASLVYTRQRTTGNEQARN